MVKWFLSEYEVYVNGELEECCGCKLYVNDEVDILVVGLFVVII